MPTDDRIRIMEAYEGYAPPRNVHSSVRKLLDTVPEKFLVGLQCVVLTNTGAPSGRMRRGTVPAGGRRPPQSPVLGYYHHEWKGAPAWIELFVDQILKRPAKYPLWIPLFRERLLGHILFHELGHHIHTVIRPEHRDREDVANDWSKKLLIGFLMKKHEYLISIIKISLRFRKSKEVLK